MGPNLSEIQCDCNFMSAGSDSKIIASAMAMIADAISNGYPADFSHLASAIDNLANALHAQAHTQMDALRKIQESLDIIGREIKYKDK